MPNTIHEESKIEDLFEKYCIESDSTDVVFYENFMDAMREYGSLMCQKGIEEAIGSVKDIESIAIIDRGEKIEEGLISKEKILSNLNNLKSKLSK